MAKRANKLMEFDYLKLFVLLILVVAVSAAMTYILTNSEVFAKAKVVPALRGVEVVWSTQTPPSGGPATVNCPSGKVALGGGGVSGGWLSSSVPSGSGISGDNGDSKNGATGWTITSGNNSGAVVVYAVCAQVGK